MGQFTSNLKADLLGTPVRVTTLAPGMAYTHFSRTRFKGDASRADEVYKGMQPLTAQDIANIIVFCVEQPPHVNITHLEVMPTAQAFGPFAVSRYAAAPDGRGGRDGRL